ncbi:tail fiber domain-containing protein [Enterocloster aldenensis]|uniref:tail fiber domain-containing protein n=1 Tax=Enterocloster aldenensis TaxID=358742 RepID=UPI003519150F
MAVFKPLVMDRNETDIDEILSKLYRFSQDLKYTIANLSLEDNMDNSVIDVLNQRNGKVREINFDADGLVIDLKDYGTGMHTSLEQTKERISLLVQSGSVVETMLTRMELHGEHITLRTGQVIVQAQNMTMDKAGNAFFSGDIIGGSINIEDRFIVNHLGECYIDGTFTTETLNPPDGIYAYELDIYNDNDVVNTVTGNISCYDAYIAETLTCRKAYQFSDRRLKTDIEPITEDTAAEALKAIKPMRYRFVDSGRSGMGCMAQDIYRHQEMEAVCLPMVSRHGRYLDLPYSSYGTIYACVIRQNQKRIERLKQAIKRRKEGERVKL